VTELPHDGTDDGFHEIQLSGKQLVFLFMATTVVSVVIFLCGVLVGRGVKGDALSAADQVAAGSVSTSPPIAPTTPLSNSSAPAETPSSPTGRDLTYPDRLGDEKRVPDVLKPVGEAKAAPESPKPAAVPPPVADPAGTSSAPVAAQATRSGTWAVQVVALSDRSAANAVVQRLTGKGYPAFLVTPQAGAPVQSYKVQVGRYNDRAEAEQMKIRLKKEEQFEPFVLR
jgi:cell division septation protein DedD